MASIKNISWKFPQKKFSILKIEILFLTIITFLIFFFIWSTLKLALAVILTFLFLIIYFIVSYLVQIYRKVEENYKLSPTHLHIVRKSRNKVKKVKISWKNIVFHKLDPFFLGGYLLTRNGTKHLLFFNVKEELKKLEHFILKNKNKSKIKKK